MVKFKKGDRVECIKEYGVVSVGRVGVVKIDDSTYIGVSWDGLRSGHTLNGRLDKSSGYNVPPKHLNILIKLSKKERDNKIKEIKKEINNNPNFKECFEDVSKEVNSWSDFKIKEW